LKFNKKFNSNLGKLKLYLHHFSKFILHCCQGAKYTFYSTIREGYNLDAYSSCRTLRINVLLVLVHNFEQLLLNEDIVANTLFYFKVIKFGYFDIKKKEVKKKG